MTVTIYHNPRCSKSRQTLELIQQNGISPKIVDYLNSEITADEVKNLLALLNTDIRTILRSSESVYKTLNLDDSSLSDNDLIQAIIANPILLQRPIVINPPKAVIGRPPENVMDIL